MRASTIESHSPAFLRARSSEIQVARWLEARGWKLLFHDVKVWRTQVDLIMRSPDGVLNLVEVKSSSAQAHLSPAQRMRLFHVANFLSGFEPVELRLAFAGDRCIEILPVDFLGY